MAKGRSSQVGCGTGEATATRDQIDQSVLVILSHFIPHLLLRWWAFRLFLDSSHPRHCSRQVLCLLLCIPDSHSKLLGGSELISSVLITLCRLYISMPHADSALVPAGLDKTQFWNHIHDQLSYLLDGQRNWVRAVDMQKPYHEFHSTYIARVF